MLVRYHDGSRSTPGCFAVQVARAIARCLGSHSHAMQCTAARTKNPVHRKCKELVGKISGLRRDFHRRSRLSFPPQVQETEDTDMKPRTVRVLVAALSAAILVPTVAAQNAVTFWNLIAVGTAIRAKSTGGMTGIFSGVFEPGCIRCPQCHPPKVPGVRWNHACRIPGSLTGGGRRRCLS